MGDRFEPFQPGKYPGRAGSGFALSLVVRIGWIAAVTMGLAMSSCGDRPAERPRSIEVGGPTLVVEADLARIAGTPVSLDGVPVVATEGDRIWVGHEDSRRLLVIAAGSRVPAAVRPGDSVDLRGRLAAGEPGLHLQADEIRLADRRAAAP